MVTLKKSARETPLRFLARVGTSYRMGDERGRVLLLLAFSHSSPEQRRREHAKILMGETRRTKYETLNKLEQRRSKLESGSTCHNLSDLELEVLNLFRISGLGFRICELNV